MKLWALSLILVSFAVRAEIGSVIDLTGTAVIKRGKETILVAKGTTVEMNDRVDTKNAVVYIRFCLRS